jgi:sterol desaturase/sphingolipid hydroxylase (fatty acid hydroxylase superfamily)
MNISMKISFLLYWIISAIGFCFSNTRIYRPKSIIRVITNQLLFQWPLFEFLFYIWPDDNTNIVWIPLQFLFCSYWHSFWFYWLHRMFHLPLFYKPFHSIHHRWVITEAYSTFDCHPVEHIVCNLMPLITGAYFIGLPRYLLQWVACIGTVFTVINHDSRSNSDHLVHHRNPSYNFESTFDRMFGTYKTDQLVISPPPYSEKDNVERPLT